MPRRLKHFHYYLDKCVPKGYRLTCMLLVSLCVHLLFILLVNRINLKKQKFEKRRVTLISLTPVQLSMLTRDQNTFVADKTFEKQNPTSQKLIHKKSTIEMSTQESEVTNSLVLTKNTNKTETKESKQAIDLFPNQVIQDAANIKTELTGAALGQVRLQQWIAEWNAHRRAQVGDTTPELQVLAQRFESWFMPMHETVARNARFGIGNLSILTRYLKAAESYGNASSKFFGDLPAQVAKIEVVIEIDHDTEGSPETWRVYQSSGDDDFDDAAIAAVQDSLNWHKHDKFQAKRPAQKTEWAFEAKAYRYFKHEELMNPGLVPKGSDLGKYDDFLGKTQIIRKTRLVAVFYWLAANNNNFNNNKTKSNQNDNAG